MKIIEELEPQRRSVYCGSIGYIGFDGNMDTNIAIRTLVQQGDHVYTWAGGGVVADSNVDAEYQESLDKAAAMLAVMGEGAGLDDARRGRRTSQQHDQPVAERNAQLLAAPLLGGDSGRSELHSSQSCSHLTHNRRSTFADSSESARLGAPSRTSTVWALQLAGSPAIVVGGSRYLAIRGPVALQIALGDCSSARHRPWFGDPTGVSCTTRVRPARGGAHIRREGHRTARASGRSR